MHGLIAVNRNAGGHPGARTPEALLDELAPLGLPIVAAGGAGDAAEFVRLMRMGYAGVQVGTRFIATTECRASDAYKEAIVESGPEDIVLTERITGVPVAVIRTPWVERAGLKAGPMARWMLRHRRTKHLMRTIYALRSLWQLKRASLDESGEHDYWQAGRSVDGIDRVEPVAAIVGRFRSALAAATGAASDVPAASN